MAGNSDRVGDMRPPKCGHWNRRRSIGTTSASGKNAPRESRRRRARALSRLESASAPPYYRSLAIHDLPEAPMTPSEPLSVPNAEMLMAELEFLSKLSQVVASTAELQPILDWIVRETTALLSADEGTIRLPDPEVAGDAMRTRV